MAGSGCAAEPSVATTRGVKTRFFGQYLLSRELITAPQLLAAVEYQAKHNSRLGEIAVGMGLLTAFNAEKINALQAREDFLFGEAAIDLDLLTRDEVASVLAEQQDVHVHLGKAITALEYMTPEAISEAVSEFEKIDHSNQPDTIAIPEDVPEGSIAYALHQLSQKLLLRAWGLTNHPAELRIELGPLLMSDRNVCVPLSGDLEATLFVGTPYDVAHRAALPFAGEAEPTDELMQDMVVQFSNVLANNLASVMAERGRRIRAGEPKTIDSHVSLPKQARTLVIPYITQQGQVLIGLSA